MDEYRVTIGIPFYNPGKPFLDSINSVLLQTHQDWELILIDDGSTDGSLEVAQSIDDSRVRVISDGFNKKLPARLNQIVKEAKYEFIARMDADDLIFPEKIQRQLEYLKLNPEIDLVSTGLVSFNSKLEIVGTRSTPITKVINKVAVLKGQSGIIHASIMARKSWFERNLYNESNRLAEDYELWISSFYKGDLKVGFIDKPYYLYREDQNVNLRKMLRGYSSQARLINALRKKNLTSHLQAINIIFWFASKMLLILPIFLFKQERRLLERRNQLVDRELENKIVNFFNRLKNLKNDNSI